MALISNARIVEAFQELATKTKQQIEHETAIKWAARAVASYELFLRTRDGQQLADAEDFYHEALEHASLVVDRGATVMRLQDEMDPVRQLAKQFIR